MKFKPQGLAGSVLALERKINIEVMKTFVLSSPVPNISAIAYTTRK